MVRVRSYLHVYIIICVRGIPLTTEIYLYGSVNLTLELFSITCNYLLQGGSMGSNCAFHANHPNVVCLSKEEH